MSVPTRWLFVRGLSREARHWLPFPERFEHDVPGSSVHLLDLPGAGTEWRRKVPLTVGGCMRDVRRRWLRLREAHPGRWAILGISLGGMVALRWTGEFASDFEHAVVINTSAADLSPPWRRMRLGVLPGITRALRTADPVAREREILRATTRIFEGHDALARHGRLPPGAAHDAHQRSAPAGGGGPLPFPGRLRVPLLVLAAAHDPLAQADCGRRIANKYRASFELHPSAGTTFPWTILAG